MPDPQTPTAEPQQARTASATPTNLGAAIDALISADNPWPDSTSVPRPAASEPPKDLPAPSRDATREPVSANPAEPARLDEPARAAETPEPAAEHDAEGDPKLSRRERAQQREQADRTQREAIERELRGQLEAEQRQKDDAQRQLSAYHQAEQERQAELERTVGSNDEFSTLHNEIEQAAFQGIYLEPEKIERYRTLKTVRDHHAYLQQRALGDAANQLLGVVGAEARQLAAEMPGVSLEAVTNAPTFRDINRHFYDAGRTTTEAEWKSKHDALTTERDTEREELNGRIDDLEAELKAARTGRLANGRSPALAGRSGSWSNRGVYDLVNTPADGSEGLFAQALAEKATSRNGHRNRE